MTKQVVILGGGHNGLVCACYLAKAGLEVLVLEKRNIIGGAAVTEEFHGGFRNSTASYTVSLLHERIIDDLNLQQHGLEIIERTVNNFLPLPDDNSLVSYPDAARNQQEVSRFSKKDSDQLPRLFELLDKVVDVIRELLLKPPPSLHKPGFSDLYSMFSVSRQFARLNTVEKQFLLKLFSVSAGELLDDRFDTDPIKALIGFDSIVGNYASPYHPGSAYVLLHHVMGAVNGKKGLWGHARGGMGAISNAIAAEALHLGVKIETGIDVAEVLINRQRVTGVRLHNGDGISADIVVSNVNPKLLHLDLIDKDVVSATTRQHFLDYKCASGSFRMNVALDELPRFSARTPSDALTGGIIMAPSLEYMDRAYQDAREFGYSKSPIVEMLIPSIIDDSLAPTGKHVASLFCQQFNPSLGARWDSEKHPAANTVIDTISAYAPNFRASIIHAQVHSPYDLEHKFGLIGGDIFHGRLSLDQLFSARPMIGIAQYETEFTNLYMCGAGTHPAGGVSGMPGYNAAKQILRKI